MNIFYLDRDQAKAAYYHCDKHVVKMILETCQILAAVHHRHGNGSNVTYKETHKNHPSTVWAGDSVANYLWLHKLGLCLCIEYTSRYGKVHKCLGYLNGELADPPKGIAEHPFIDPPQCMPDEYKVEDTVTAYHNYYRVAKAYMAKWKHGIVPKFMTKE